MGLCVIWMGAMGCGSSAGSDQSSDMNGSGNGSGTPLQPDAGSGTTASTDGSRDVALEGPDAGGTTDSATSSLPNEASSSNAPSGDGGLSEGGSARQRRLPGRQRHECGGGRPARHSDDALGNSLDAARVGSTDRQVGQFRHGPHGSKPGLGYLGHRATHCARAILRRRVHVDETHICRPRHGGVPTESARPDGLFRGPCCVAGRQELLRVASHPTTAKRPGHDDERPMRVIRL
jgi:hypothetical protein